MKATIRHNSGGYHGHQMKDWLGGRTLCHLFGLDYVHTPYPYLSNFGLGNLSPQLSKWQRWTTAKTVIAGPQWDGFTEYQAMLDYFQPRVSDGSSMIVFENAARVHPFQCIPWFEDGMIDKDIFDLILMEVSNGYQKVHPPKQRKNDLIKVAIHVSRGVDYNPDRFPEHFEDSYNVRYMFPLSYFQQIIDQIETVIDRSNVEFHIYTEALHSQDIVDEFKIRSNTFVHVGNNRKEKNDALIYGIFDDFVNSDILVACNSSFSAMCTYFRKNKVTIYHPHKHLDHLPGPHFIPTDKEGLLLRPLDLNQLSL